MEKSNQMDDPSSLSSLESNQMDDSSSFSSLARSIANDSNRPRVQFTPFLSNPFISGPVAPPNHPLPPPHFVSINSNPNPNFYSSHHVYQPQPQTHFQPQPHMQPQSQSIIISQPLPLMISEPQQQMQPQPQQQMQPQPQQQIQPQPQHQMQMQTLPKLQMQMQTLSEQQMQPQPQQQMQMQMQPQPQSQMQPQPQQQMQMQSQPQQQMQMQLLLEQQMQPQSQPPMQQMQPQQQMPPPQAAHVPAYSKMITAAITALNEPDGSSKMAISKFIERTYTNLPSTHGALLTDNLKTLKTSGVLAMVRKSYKIAGTEIVADVAGVEPPRSEILPMDNTSNDQQLLMVVDPVAVSASDSVSQPQKRGRGRPPKAKPEAAQQLQLSEVEVQVEPIAIQSNGQKSLEQQYVLPVTNPTELVQESAKRRPGRPRKDGTVSAALVVPASDMAAVMKRRGRPPGRRAAGRQRKPKSVPASASVYPYVRRGRPSMSVRGGATSYVAAPVDDGETVAAVEPRMKRGRGRPPKIGGVISRLIAKPKRGRGRPAGRPRKNTTRGVTGATGGTQDDAGYEELKRKFDLFQEKAKEIVNVLKAGVASDNQAVMQAIQDLEGLTVETVDEPQTMEEVQPHEAPPITEVAAVETQGEEVQPEEALPNTEAAAAEAQDKEQGHGTEGGEAETVIGTENQPHAEAEAMQEAMF